MCGIDYDTAECVADRSGSECIYADVVPLNLIADCSRVIEPDTSTGIAANQIAIRFRDTAYPIEAGTGGSHDAEGTIWQCRHSGRVDANPISLHLIAIGVGIDELHAEAGIARDQVARTGSRTADEVVMRADIERDALIAVGNGAHSGEIGSNLVAFDAVSTRGSALEVDAIVGVTGNQIAGARRSATDEVARPAIDDDTGPMVANGEGARFVGSDQIAFQEIASRRGTRDSNSRKTIARNGITIA